ncbi:hypothetical protein ATY81_16340 [Rhizobium sp. R72]|nr:hypothetical protein ATY81_16340 [Rhizobium sp. R72]OWV92939.1 hypothetical protein ATY80_16340 [Rhizobium sp. R711]
MVAVFIALLLFLSPAMPGLMPVASPPTSLQVSVAHLSGEDCDPTKLHHAPQECCALQCQVFVAEAVPGEVLDLPVFVDVAYPEPVEHLTGIAVPPSVGPPRAVA